MPKEAPQHTFAEPRDTSIISNGGVGFKICPSIALPRSVEANPRERGWRTEYE